LRSYWLFQLISYYFLHDRNFLRASSCLAGALAFTAIKSIPGSRHRANRSPLSV
jgi:hypothetical protein